LTRDHRRCGTETPRAAATRKPRQGLTEEALHRRLRFADVDQPPVRLPRHWIDVLLPQKPYVVRLLQHVHIARIVSELAVVKLDRANILIAAMDRLHLAVAPQLVRNLRSRHAQRQQHQKDQHDRSEQHEPLLAIVSRLWT
jgi:hypothetical protein